MGFFMTLTHSVHPVCCPGTSMGAASQETLGRGSEQPRWSAEVQPSSSDRGIIIRARRWTSGVSTVPPSFTGLPLQDHHRPRANGHVTSKDALNHPQLHRSRTSPGREAWGPEMHLTRWVYQRVRVRDDSHTSPSNLSYQALASLG